MEDDFYLAEAISDPYSEEAQKLLIESKRIKDLKDRKYLSIEESKKIDNILKACESSENDTVKCFSGLII